MSKNFDTRQSEHRSALEQLTGPDSNKTLKDILPAVNSEVTPPFALRANDSGNDRQLNVSANILTNPQTSRKRANSPVNNQFFEFTSGTILFPSTSGGSITVTPGTNTTLTVGSNEYIKVLIQIDENGDLSVKPGTPDATEANATVEAPDANTLALGFVTLFNNAGTIDNLSDSNILQFVGSNTSTTSSSSNSVQVVTTNTTLSNNTIYIADKNTAGSLELILPETSVQGDFIKIIGEGTSGWSLLSNSSATSQFITDCSGNTSVISDLNEILLVASTGNNGTGIIQLTCTEDNSKWMVEYSDCILIGANYFGDGSDGDVIISSNTDLIPPNITGSYDAEMIVKNYTSLTINSGVTLQPSQPCRGMLIYCTGDITINGTLSMTGKGAFRNPSDVDNNGLQFQRFTSSGNSATPTFSTAYILSGCGSAAENAEANQTDINGFGDVFTIPKIGGSAGTGGIATSVPPGQGAYSGGEVAPTVGGAGSGTGQVGTGGGGGGGMGSISGTNSGSGGEGAPGTCFSGGTGGGGATDSTNAGDGASFGGAGGNGTGGSEYGGGAGNPTGSTSGSATTNGTGGLLIIICKGNVTIGGSGNIEANGINPHNVLNGGGAGGSGGGAILILHAGNYTNSGSVTVDGGAKGSGGNGNMDGADGGAGVISVNEIL